MTTGVAREVSGLAREEGKIRMALMAVISTEGTTRWTNNDDITLGDISEMAWGQSTVAHLHPGHSSPEEQDVGVGRRGPDQHLRLQHISPEERDLEAAHRGPDRRPLLGHSSPDHEMRDVSHAIPVFARCLKC